MAFAFFLFALFRAADGHCEWMASFLITGLLSHGDPLVLSLTFIAAILIKLGVRHGQ